MNNIIVNPDIHGRHFWEESAKHVNEINKIIFLGDYFDPYDFEKISVEDAIENFKQILEFKKNNIDRIVSCANDFGVITAAYVAEKMGLNANSIECSEIATNKYMMRNAFRMRGDPIPKFIEVTEHDDYDISDFSFPLIVKPTDRSALLTVFRFT